MSIKINKGEYSTILDSTTLTANQTITFPNTSGTVMLSNGSGGNLVDMFYPVGSIYMTTNANFNPSRTWGGTWVKIENRFLYGSGSKAVGATGGAETVTLSVSQIPSHNHSLTGVRSTGSFGTGKTRQTGNTSAEYPATGVFTKTGTPVNTANGAEASGRQIDFDTSRSVSGTSGNQGGGGSHENMPPYIVVVIWKRTA